jgi:hypothetical protein
VLEGVRLVLRVEHNFSVCTWKAESNHVPGEWPKAPSLPDTITWKPEKEDAQEGYHWVPVVTTDSRSFLVQPAHLSTPTISPDNPGVVCPKSWNLERSQLLDGIQDDHTFKAIMLTNQSEPRRRRQTYTRRRSASDPAIERQHEGRDDNMIIPGPWRGHIHKCAFDLRWNVRKSSFTSYPARHCVQGRCHQEIGSPSPWYWRGTWEAELLGDERHVRVAGRFARRFCPEHLDIVDRTLARATERSRLTIGPPRAPAKPW